MVLAESLTQYTMFLILCQPLCTSQSSFPFFVCIPRGRAEPFPNDPLLKHQKHIWHVFPLCFTQSWSDSHLDTDLDLYNRFPGCLSFLSLSFPTSPGHCWKFEADVSNVILENPLTSPLCLPDEHFKAFPSATTSWVHFPYRPTPANTKLFRFGSLSYHSIFLPNLYLNPSHHSRPFSHGRSNLARVTFIIPRPCELFHAREKSLHWIVLIIQWGLVHFVSWEARPLSHNSIRSFSWGSYLYSIFFFWVIWGVPRGLSLVQTQSWILVLPKQFC